MNFYPYLLIYECKKNIFACLCPNKAIQIFVIQQMSYNQTSSSSYPQTVPYYSTNQPAQQPYQKQLIIQQIQKAFKNLNKLCQQFFKHKFGSHFNGLNPSSSTNFNISFQNLGVIGPTSSETLSQQRNFNNYKGQQLPKHQTANLQDLQNQDVIFDQKLQEYDNNQTRNFNNYASQNTTKNTKKYVPPPRQQEEWMKEERMDYQQGEQGFYQRYDNNNRNERNYGNYRSQQQRRNDYVNWNRYKEREEDQIQRDRRKISIPAQNGKKNGGNYNQSLGSSNGTRQQTPSSQSNKKQIIPPPPKAPLSPYFNFYKQKKDLIKQQFPDMSVSQIASAAAKVWKSLQQQQKAPYTNKYWQQKRNYDNQLKQYQKKYPNYKQIMKKAAQQQQQQGGSNAKR